MESNPLPNRVENEVRNLREQQDSQWWRDEKNRSIHDGETFVHPNEVRMMKRIAKVNRNSTPLDPTLAIILVVISFTVFALCTIIF